MRGRRRAATVWLWAAATTACGGCAQIIGASWDEYALAEGAVGVGGTGGTGASGGTGEGAVGVGGTGGTGASGGTGGACPSCGGQSFEGPPGGSSVDLAGTGATYDWSAGDINALPDAIARQGTQEPCTTSEDCQFDQYCDHPARGACAHDPCATGDSLLTTCNGCVTKICDARPSCCTQTAVPGDCAHDACQAIPGAATNMTATCGDACIANICAANPRCCDITCTSSTQCAAIIGPDSTCIVGGRCTASGGVCPAETVNSNGTCTGVWSAACVNLVAAQCPGKTCGGPAPIWDATCVGLTEALCGAACSAEPGEQRGLCEPYRPNQTNPACAGVDLTVGVPCGGTVPVCNRGNTQAPAGIAIHRYAAGAGQLPSSAPSRVLDACSPTGGTLACTTAQPIEPGECISVAGCSGVVDGMELIVNPPGAGHVAECQCANNGSVYQSAACASPGCAATASVSPIKPVTMFVALDASTSMRRTTGSSTDNTITSRWIPATDALKTFFADPGSAGLGVAFRFWPHNNPGLCSASPACPGAGGSGCALPLVPFDGTATRRLTEDAAPADPQELALISAIDSLTPNGDTPMYPALDGATTWAINYKNAHPEEEVAVVFITDGTPSHCDTVPRHIASLARNAFENYGVRVHAVGFGNSDRTIINLIADHGGGQAHNLVEGATLQSGLRDALVSIRGDAASCEVAVPVSDVVDPGSVSVVRVDRAGGETTLTPRSGLDSCGDGWYFADASNTRVKLCPPTCADLRENPGGKLRATVPCVAETLAPITTPWERYHAVCPPGTRAQWEYLTYRTATPGDSSVEFFTRSADDPADLGAATVTLAATARATPADTQICDETSTPPCAVDLLDVLGELPGAHADYLEIQVRLNPTSDGEGGVRVQGWEITYSCPDAE
ncbi:vWA domain-containing protein [Sorangium sp. So ce388]|uniref:vWA domain-containing protein n=1 Tax=Sorangium sp. So ce388 TaxID=3133309 RepID=UPI003F5C0735